MERDIIDYETCMECERTGKMGLSPLEVDSYASDGIHPTEVISNNERRNALILVSCDFCPIGLDFLHKLPRGEKICINPAVIRAYYSFKIKDT